MDSVANSQEEFNHQNCRGCGLIFRKTSPLQRADRILDHFRAIHGQNLPFGQNVGDQFWAKCLFLKIANEFPKKEKHPFGHFPDTHWLSTSIKQIKPYNTYEIVFFKCSFWWRGVPTHMGRRALRGPRGRGRLINWSLRATCKGEQYE